MLPVVHAFLSCRIHTVIFMSRMFRTVFMRRFVLVLSLVASLSVVTFAQPEPPLTSVTYRLRMSRPVSHLFEVAIEVELPKDSKLESLDFQMPKWSPGRYAVFDFAKNVQEFLAFHGICNPRADCMLPRASVT